LGLNNQLNKKKLIKVIFEFRKLLGPDKDSITTLNKYPITKIQQNKQINVG
jgi:biotin synthase-like enzyme